VFISQTFGAVIFGAVSLADSTTAWTQLQCQVYAPAGAARAIAIGQVLAAGGAAEIHYFDDVILAGRGAPAVQPQIFTITSIGDPSIGYVNVGFTPNAASNLVVGEVMIQTGPPDLGALLVYAAFGSTAYFPHWGRLGGPVTFAFTLTDGTKSLQFSKTVHKVKGSSNSGRPIWVKVTAPIPYQPGFNYRAVTGYSVTIRNRANDLIYTEAYIDSLTAVPATYFGPALQRGQVIHMAGIKGTARTSAAWTFQQQGSPALVTVPFVTPGSYLWRCPPLVTSVAPFGVGGSGDASPFSPSFGGGGGAGGSSGQSASVAVTPGNLYPVVVGRRGINGGDGTLSSFTGDGGVTITCPAGHGAGLSLTGGLAGAAGTNGFAGGPGGNGVNGSTGGGGAGGSSGGTSAPGVVGGNASGLTGGLPGSPPAGAGIGGRGGTRNVGNGTAPATGYGGAVGGSPGQGFGRRDYGGFADGFMQLTYLQPPQAKTLIVHRPSFDAPDTFCPFVSLPVTDVPDGTTEYALQSMIAGLPARFDGTYTIIGINFSWDTPAASRDVHATINQYDQAGGTSTPYSTPVKTFVPNTDADISKNGIVILGEVTLPGRRLPHENAVAQFTISLSDSNANDRWLDLLLVDSQGSLLIVNSTVPYTNYLVDPPIAEDIGLIMGTVADRDTAVSVTDQCLVISGPPLGVDPDGCQTLVLYAVEGAPGAHLEYYPHWRSARFM
jgi:hypothetical protein